MPNNRHAKKPRGTEDFGGSNDEQASADCATSIRPSCSLTPYSLFFSVSGSRRSPPPHRAEGSLADPRRHVPDEVRRPQDAFQQLKRQPGQFIKRPSHAYRGLYRIGPTEAKRFEQPGAVLEERPHQRIIHVVLLHRPLGEHCRNKPPRQTPGPLARRNAVQTGPQELVGQTQCGRYPICGPRISPKQVLPIEILGQSF